MRIFATALFISIMISGCFGVGVDEPFVFPPAPAQPEENPPPPPPSPCTKDEDCSEGQICKEEACVANSCTTDADCRENERCQDSVCIPVTDGGECTTDADCETGETCNTETHLCQVVVSEDVCLVNFDATLELRADAPSATSDIPPLCTTYPNPPYSDLVCCTATGEALPPTSSGEELECDAADHLAITRWKSASGPIKLKFDLSNGCKVILAAQDFSEFKLENSGLDAALIIDAGKTSTDPRLRDYIAISDCHETEHGIEIDGLPLQFMVRLYDNFTQCQVLGRDNCVGPSFSRWFFDQSPASEPPPPQSLQILPGLSRPSFLLKTGADSASPAPGTANVASISTAGIPMHLDTATGKTVLQLSVAFALPNDSTSDPENGTGLLTGPLANAVLTAEIGGVVTNPSKPDGTIQNLADLAAHCSSTGGGPGEVDLTVTAASLTVDGEAVESLPVSEDAAARTTTVDTCMPGIHLGNDCGFFPVHELPFAKEEGDPRIPGTEARFIKNAVISLTAEPTAVFNLSIPEQVGAFRVINANELNALSLAPLVTSVINLQIAFAPEADRSQCSTSGTVVTCSADLEILQAPRVVVRLRGQARTPDGVVKLEEIGLAPPNAPVTGLLPLTSGSPEVSFAQQIIGVGTETRLYRVSNVGVRGLNITSLAVGDINRNFRIGSIYQGPDFAHRLWKTNLPSWTVAPTGQDDLFFFLNYGPFARPRVTQSDNVRPDSTSLNIQVEEQPNIVLLHGSAKLDLRAKLGLYIEDETRYTNADNSVCNAADSCLLREGRPLYLARGLSFSLRQEGSARPLIVRNEGREDLKILETPTLEDPNARFAAALEGTYPLIIPPGDSARIGTLSFDTTDPGSYQVFESRLVLQATSGSGSLRPSIEGGEPGTPASSDTTVRYALRGSAHSPTGTNDLVIHRLMSGLDNFISTGQQLSLISSSSTQGILERLGADDITRYLEKFRIEDGIELDPVNGIATLHSIFTPVDPNTNAIDLNGIRLFNNFGSNPGSKEYLYECVRENGSCRFFYLYIADWSAANQAATGCGGAAISTLYPSGIASVVDPRPAGNPDCMRRFLEGFTSRGRFDPVTGEITFKDLAVRLFAPETIVGDVDSGLRVALSTECIAPQLMPDTNAQANRLVHSRIINDHSFNAAHMDAQSRNPLFSYMGSPCAETNALHGQRMRHPFVNGDQQTFENEDLTETIDFGGGTPPGPLTLDLVGIGRLSSTNNLANGRTMYMVIKAEIE